jgi:hypothetical protein
MIADSGARTWAPLASRMHTPDRATARWRSELAAQDLDQLFELEPHLMDELLALIEIDLRVIAGEAVARAADGEALLVQQAADLADDRCTSWRW